jgi:hypothetical protein
MQNDSQSDDFDDDAKLDELETLQNKIADQLSELSNVEALPSGYKSFGSSFESSEVNFASSSWLLKVCQVQPWLRLNDDIDSKLAEVESLTIANKLFGELHLRPQEICVTADDGNLKLTLVGAEVLADRLDVALRLQNQFSEWCETLNKKSATEMWIEAWEEESE